MSDEISDTIMEIYLDLLKDAGRLGESGDGKFFRGTCGGMWYITDYSAYSSDKFYIKYGIFE
ncbi:MAG: hypothetical protein WC523_04885 [Patescibacteria group bacterium]